MAEQLWNQNQNGGESPPPQNMSSLDLISHPGTLRGGMSLFKQMVTNQLTTDEFNAKIGVEEDQNVCSNSSSQTSYGSQDSVIVLKQRLRPRNDKGLTSTCNSQTPLSKKRKLRDNKLNDSDEENISESSKGKRWNNTTPEESGSQSQMREDPTEDDDASNCQDVLSEDQCNAQFGELMKRFDQPQVKSGQCQKSDEDFDLSNRRQLMRSVFTDYDEKERLCEIHSRKIMNMRTEELKAHFCSLQDEICDIFEGKLNSNRMLLYCSNDKKDRSRLGKLVVADPFSNLHSMMLATELIEFLIPKPKNRMKYTDFIKLVMLPELLIRIYAKANEICYDQAEKEMKWGPRYDGPIGVVEKRAKKTSKSSKSSSKMRANKS